MHLSWGRQGHLVPTSTDREATQNGGSTCKYKTFVQRKQLPISSRKNFMTIFWNFVKCRRWDAVTPHKVIQTSRCQWKNCRESSEEHFELLNVTIGSKLHLLRQFFWILSLSKVWFSWFSGSGTPEGIPNLLFFEIYVKFWIDISQKIKNRRG